MSELLVECGKCGETLVLDLRDEALPRAKQCPYCGAYTEYNTAGDAMLVTCERARP